MSNNYFLQSSVTVDFSTPFVPLKPFWNATGYANADFTYTPAFGRMYDYLSSYANHMKYMRLHNILTLHGEGDRYIMVWNGNQRFEYGNHYNGADKVVFISEEGALRYNWSLVDKVYDIIIDHQMVPIVELVYIPAAIRKSAEEFYLPCDYSLYAQVIEAFVRHCAERYGLDEVRKWYFEVWNEPDNKPKWCEDASTFLAMYDYMEYAVHCVDESLRVGGPATMQFDESYVLFERFLQHCAEEVNYCTGRYGTRVDFVSVHCKGGRKDSYCASTNIMFDAIKRYTDIMKKYPKYKDTEFFNDESDIVWSGNAGIAEQSWLNFRNTHYAPGFVCKMVSRYCTEVEDDGIRLAIVDSDNSHLQWEGSLFSGNRSQLTPLCSYPTGDLLKKPFFNAYVLLARLGTKRWHAESNDKAFGKKFGVLPTASGDVLSVLVWNFEDGLEDEFWEREISLQLHGLKEKVSYRMIEYRIDASHSNANSAWREMGAPAAPSGKQIALLRSKADLEPVAGVQKLTADGTELYVMLKLPPHAVSLILLAPENAASPASVQQPLAKSEKGYNGNWQVFLKWEPCQETDFMYYRIWRKKEGEAFEVISDRISLNTATFVDMEVREGEKYSYRIDTYNLSMRCSEGAESAIVEIP